MATSGNATGAYSGRTAYFISMSVSRSATSGTSAKWKWTLYARNPNGSTATYALNNYPWSANVEGQTWSGSHNLDFRSGATQILLGSGETGWIDQGTSTRVINFSASHSTSSVFGSASASGSFTANALSGVPSAPPTPVITGSTPTSISFTIAQPSSNGGSPVLDYEMRVTSGDGATLIGTWSSGASSQNTAGRVTLVPGTSYRILYRARNANGYGPYSNYATGTTQASTAPGINVTPSLAGTSASVALTPPSGTTVTSYRIEYRQTGTTTATTVNTTTTPRVVSPLIPGRSYDWRASAFIGTYQSPWSAWQTKVQPNPNTNPGDYFDGSTTDKTDTVYDWVGTANNSMSTASGFRPLGWGAFESGNAESGGAGSVIRASGGFAGSFSARVTFSAGTQVVGFHAGLDTAAPGVVVTTAGTNHNALIHVRLPSRSQSLAAMLLWVDGSGDEVGRTVGEPQAVISSGDEWTPLSVSGPAPAGAVGVAVRVIDVEGPSWSRWVSGDVMLIDAAITPWGDSYFDGSTPDTDQYIYAWEGTANNSASTRTPNASATPVDPLADPDCPPIPAPPRPPYIDDSCVEDNTVEWRRIYVSIDNPYDRPNPEWFELIPTLALSATTNVRLVRIRYFQNPFNRSLDNIDQETYCVEQIITFIPAGAILTIDGVSERLWAEVAGSSANIAADHLLATQTGDTDQWAALTCGMPYYITIDIPIDTPAGAVSASYELTARYR